MCPDKQTIAVPEVVSVPISLNHPEPFRTISGTYASVLTLLMLVGFCQRPAAAGNGGLNR
ncbi:uncharacterized protein METZ01_LOCUS320542, partial [marine metagenome]